MALKGRTKDLCISQAPCPVRASKVGWWISAFVHKGEAGLKNVCFISRERDSISNKREILLRGRGTGGGLP